MKFELDYSRSQELSRATCSGSRPVDTQEIAGLLMAQVEDEVVSRTADGSLRSAEIFYMYISCAKCASIGTN